LFFVCCLGQCGRSRDEQLINLRYNSERGKLQYAMSAGKIDLSLFSIHGSIVDIRAGFYDSAILYSDGTCVVFGGNGQMDGYNYIPRIFMEDTHVWNICFGLAHTTAIIGDKKQKQTWSS
jgi:hypothetical protein